MSERMADIAAGLILLLLYLAPLALLWAVVRWLRRVREAKKAKAQEEIAAAPAEGPAEDGYRIDMSAVFGALAMYAVFLLLIFVSRGRWWGYVGQALYLLLLGATFWSAFSRENYEQERKKAPELTRREYVTATLMFFAFLPILGWLGIALPIFLYNLGLLGAH